MWFGTDGGVCRYDGRTFHTFTTKDGLADNTVKAVLLDHSDNLWFGTADGVSKFAPGSGQSEQTWTTFTTRDGLVYNDVQTVLQDRNGHLWFGTSGGGVSRFDGKVFQSLTDEDGLASNNVWDILQDREGNIWFATLRGGLTRYRQPEPFPPSIRINAVVADRRYEQTSELELPSTVGLITFTFAGANLKTRSEAMVYRYRLSGYETEWNGSFEM